MSPAVVARNEGIPEIGRVFRVSEHLQYGMVGINSGLISTELAPFGGVQGERERS